MKKLLAAVAIGCAAVVALAGCGPHDDRESNSVDELKSKYGYQWEDPTKPILNDEGAKAISFHIYSSKNASALDYNSMDIMQTLYEDTNVYVDWENVSETVYGEQKTLKLGKHDGIDAIYHAGMSASEIIKYANRKALLPVSDYLEYMPNFKAILEKRPDIKKQITNVEDGKIYALPRVEEMGLLQNPNLLFLNKTWAQEAVTKGNIDIGSQEIADGLELTSAQMEQILTYFRDNDMNGNGSTTDERPLSFVYNNWQGNQCDLYGMFGINDNTDHRIIKNDKVTCTVLDPAFKDATKFIANWIKEGLIDKVSLEVSQDNFLASGKGTGQDVTYGAFYWWESETVVSHPEDYICCKPLKGPNGAQTVCVSNNPEVSPGEVIFFNGIPNVEVLLTYFDRYYLPQISAQMNYGPIGIVFDETEYANTGKLVTKPIPEGMTADELRLQNAPLGLCYLTAEQWGSTVEMEPRAKLRLERLEKYEKNFVPADVKPVPNLQFTQQELNTITQYQNNINSYIRNQLMTFLLNGVSSDDAWNTFTAELSSQRVGLDALTKVYQDAYDRYLNEN